MSINKSIEEIDKDIKDLEEEIKDLQERLDYLKSIKRERDAKDFKKFKEKIMNEVKS